MVHEAGGTGRDGESADQKIVGEMLERESGVAPYSLGQGRVLEDSKHLPVGSDVGDSVPQEAKKEGSRPSSLLADEHRKRFKEDTFCMLFRCADSI